MPSLIVLVTAAIGLGWEEGKKPIARNQMTDQELIIDALEQAQRILAEYIEPGRGSRRPDFTVSQLLLVLDRKDLALARERLKARCGLKLVEPMVPVTIGPAALTVREARPRGGGAVRRLF